MKKNILLFAIISFVMSANLSAQFTTTSITSDPTLSTCQKDTLIFEINNGSGGALVGHFIEVDVPPGFEVEAYDSTILNNGISLGGDSYRFEIINLAIGVNQIELYTSVPCGAVTAGDYKVNLVDPGFSSLYRDTSSLNSVSAPFLIIDGCENTLHNINNTTYLNGAPIDLSLLKTGDTLVRKFRIKMTTINSEILNYTVSAPKFAFDILGVSDAINVTFNANNDTAFYEFNAPLIGASLPGGGLDSLVFTDTIVIQIGCNPSSTSFNHAVSVEWGCGSTCDVQSTNVEGNMIPPSPVPQVSYITNGHISAFDQTEQPGEYSFCEQNYMEFRIANNSVGDPIPGSMFDIDVQFGLRDGNLSSFEQNNVSYDSVLVNGISVPMRAGNLPGRRYIDTLTSLTYSGTGLVDLNGDGYLNDMLPGDTISVRYYFKIDAVNNQDSCYDNVGNTYWNNRFWIEAPYTDICAEAPSTTPSDFHQTGGGFGLQLILQSSDDFLYITGAEDSLFSLELTDVWRTRGTSSSRIVQNHMFIVPNYVKPRGFSSSISGATISVINNGPLEDTVIVSGNDNDFTEISTVNFAIVCALKTNPCDNQPFQVTGKSVLKLIDANGDVCDSICAQEKSAFVQDIACDSIISEMMIIDTIFERATFGWTDETMLTLATRETPGVMLDLAHNFDSLRVYTKAVSHNSILLDSLFFHLNYIQPFTDLSQFPDPGFEPLSILNTYARLRIYDEGSSTDQEYIINDLLPYIDSFSTDTTTSGLTNYVLNFSNFIDSMRATAAGPNFVIGGDVASIVFSSDTVEIELFFYGNQMDEEFEITPQIQIASNSIVNATAIPGFCLLPSTVSKIDIKAFSLSEYLIHSHQGDCSGTRTTIGQGSAGPPPNYYFPEVREIGVVDTMMISWDSDYLGLTDSTVYFDESRSIFGGFAIHDTLPKDNSRFYYGDDSLYIFPQDSTWQDFIDFSYGLNLQQTCQATSNSQISVDFDIVGRDYAEGIGGPYDFLISRTDGAGIDNGDPQTLSPINLVPFITADTACWYFRLENLTSTDYSNFNWLNLHSTFGSFDVFSLQELDGSLPSSNVLNTFDLYEHTPGYKWAKADDSLLFNEIKYFRSCAVIDNCIGDSLIIESGFNCAGWPDTASFTYPTSGYICPSNTKQIKIFNDAPSARIEYLVTNQPSGTVMPCDTLDYTVLIRNVGLGNANQVSFVSTADTNGLHVVPNNSVLEFPVGTFTTLPNPIATSNSYSWDFSSEINVGSPLEQTGNPNDEAWISFQVVTGCPFEIGTQLEFQVSYLRDCGVADTLNSLTSDPVIITGVPSAQDKIISLSDLDTSNDFCVGQEISFGLLHQGGVASSSNTLIQISIDSSFDIYDVVSGFNTTVLANTTPDSNYIESGLRVLEYNFNNSFTNGDSAHFNFIVSEDSTFSTQTCGDIVPFSVRVLDRYISTCTSSSVVCPVYFELDTANGVFDYQKSNYSINNFIANYTLCDDSLSFSFDVDVTDSDVSPDNLEFIFVADFNSNDVYDGGDQLISIANNRPTDTLRDGTTSSFAYKVLQSDYLSSDVCQLLILIDSNTSCACSNTQSSTVVDYTGVSTLYTLNTCTDSVVLSGCVGAQMNKTFNWVDANSSGAESLLSSTSIDSVSFYPNTSISNTTTYTYYIEVDRGGCIARDTAEVSVSPVSTGLTYSNDTASYELCSDSLSFSFSLDNTNSSSYGAGGTNVVEVYADSNQNGLFDGADVLISTSFSYDSIMANSSLTFSSTISQFDEIGYDICNLIIRPTSTSGCGNDSNALIVSINNINTNQTFSVGDCDEPIDLSICDSLYPNRTYSWVGQGANNPNDYISSAIDQSTLFSPERGMTLGQYIYIVDIMRGNCLIKDTMIIDVNESTGPCGLLVIPSFISPVNTDGLNDTWLLNGISNYPGNEVEIFNRWGESVYRTTNYDNSNPFDGTQQGNGATLPSGTYFYIVKLQDGFEPRTGYVHIENVK